MNKQDRQRLTAALAKVSPGIKKQAEELAEAKKLMTKAYKKQVANVDEGLTKEKIEENRTLSDFSNKVLDSYLGKYYR